MKPKPVIFIAGPFRSTQPGNEWERTRNIRHAETWAYYVWNNGGYALCPHTNTGNFQGALPDEVFLDGCIALMMRCDAVLTIPGWEKSSGASNEIKYAKDHSLPVIEATQLMEFINDWQHS